MYARMLKKNTPMENQVPKNNTPLGFYAMKMIFDYGNVYNLPSNTLDHIKPADRTSADMNTETERSLLVKIAKTIHTRNVKYNEDVERFAFVINVFRSEFGAHNLQVQYQGNPKTYSFAGACHFAIDGYITEWCGIRTDCHEYPKRIVVYRGLFDDRAYHDTITHKKQSEAMCTVYTLPLLVKAIRNAPLLKKKAQEHLAFPPLPKCDWQYWTSLPNSLHRGNQRWYHIERDLRQRQWEEENARNRDHYIGTVRFEIDWHANNRRLNGDVE